MHKHLSYFLRNRLLQTRAVGSIAWYLCCVDEAVANTKIRKYVDHIYMTDSEKKSLPQVRCLLSFVYK